MILLGIRSKLKKILKETYYDNGKMICISEFINERRILK